MSEKLQKKSVNKKILNEVSGYCFMLVGCIFYAASTSLFLAPNNIVAGGVTGLSVIVNFLNPNLLVGIVSIVLNIPILIFGIKFNGWKFILRCLITIVTLGLFTDLIQIINISLSGGDNPITDNQVLASVYGGFCQGIGIGLFVKFQFSSGGTELLARVINHFFKSINIPVCLGILDGIIVILGTVVTQKIDNMFYALIVVFLSTKVSEVVLIGFDKSKFCIIITDKGEEIAKTLIEKSPRGVTMLHGEGMYTHNEHQLLLTCVKSNQLIPLKKIVNDIDSKAFIIVNESIEVRGQGFKALNEDIDDKKIKN